MGMDIDATRLLVRLDRSSGRTEGGGVSWLALSEPTARAATS